MCVLSHIPVSTRLGVWLCVSVPAMQKDRLEKKQMGRSQVCLVFAQTGKFLYCVLKLQNRAFSSLNSEAYAMLWYENEAEECIIKNNLL